MAVRKAIVLSNGITVSHHRIVSADIDWLGKKIRVIIAHYLDINARIEDKDPIQISRYEAIVEDEFPLTDGGAVQNELYTWLKTLPMYGGAVDEIIGEDI